MSGDLNNEWCVHVGLCSLPSCKRRRERTRVKIGDKDHFIAEATECHLQLQGGCTFDRGVISPKPLDSVVHLSDIDAENRCNGGRSTPQTSVLIATLGLPQRRMAFGAAPRL
jgi:hypothetical protein